ncbi:flavoprotein [Kribbella monticola]|uniref:flavoprotein n=1 Tax=Kribbella monticola TaxID=2185285 RepID=UPI000DD33016|nr:flavoprotein [Kribbella monticola]
MSECKVVGVVASGAGGVEHLRSGLVEPLVALGHTVAVTPAARWLEDIGEIGKLEAVTGLPVRSEPRLPGEERSHPRADAYVVGPASANTVAKLALGIGDNQALSALCESVNTIPMLVFPRVNAAHARHPACRAHLEVLRSTGVQLLYGNDIWALHEPRSEGDRRPLPWAQIVEAAQQLMVCGPARGGGERS